MGFRINTNIAALQAHTSATMNNKNLDNSLSRLSSGLRINKAADDASGMAIADSLQAQASGLNQAINNANDGVAVVQTADGALDEYINIINTVRTKAIQAASDGQNATSREAIQRDIDKLLEEAQNIATTTSFNGQQLLDGTFTNKAFHIGAYAGETVGISISDAQTSALGDITGISGGETHAAFVTSTDLSESATGQALNASSLVINDIDVTSSINELAASRLTDAASVASAITDATGLIASATNSFTAGAAVAAGTIDATNYLKINGVSVADTTVLANDSNGALVKAINDISEQTGVTASLNTSNQLVLESTDGSNIAISTNNTVVAQVQDVAVTLGNTTSNNTITWNDGAVSASYTLTAADVGDADAALTALAADITASAAGYTASYASGTLSITKADGTSFTSTLGGTTVPVNGGETVATTGYDVTANTVSGLTADNLTDATGSGTVATLSSTATAAVTIAEGELIINGVDLAGTYGDGSTAGSARTALQSAIQAIDGMEESTIATNGTLTLVVNNGDDLNIAGTEANNTYNLTAGVTNESKIGSIQIFDDENIKLSGTVLDAFGFTAGTKSVTDQGVSLDSIDVTTRDSAEKAILIADSALLSLDTIRSELGSVQNQLESTVRNISVTAVNVTAAESQIRDVDFAAESADFSKFNILAQSGSYAMAQANSVQQNVMRLLQ